ncbi:hypothetical protein CYMTET_23827, partial [Cymbomonas tetramitiformis]
KKKKKKKKKKKWQAVVHARCSEAAPQPIGCGTPPFGASQRLMWTVCMLSMFVCVAGALRGTGELHLAGVIPADVAAELFTDGHGRVWYYPEPVEVTFRMHEIDGWELRLREAVDVLTATVRQTILPADGGAAAAGGELAAGGAGTYEDYDDNATGFGDGDEYED